ncbi:PAS domain-containing protein [Rhizobium sp. BK008]|uniref:blue-light-activated histidine kinase n=1 Tax=Rhizobium sp. BK008 TaxID=2587094 RepID=UPI00161F1447|nr:PAS domain-containing protein [Rhizobium sp. BK008]MBB4251931.1 PAS domain S-box-containing protein [Rhizobium sp. BK008]
MTSHSTRKLHGDLPSAASKVAAADRKELAAIAFERTRMPMVVADARTADVPIVLANKAFLELTGYAAEEVLGRNCRFLQGPATSPIAVAEIRAGIAGEHEVNVEILNYRKSGEQFWNRLHLSPVHGDDGQILYFFGSQIDITEYRRIEALEASEHRLLREVDHRTKNVLAIVDSIVRLSNAEDPALYAASIQHRVQALARAHALLAERRWTSISVEELVRQQVTPFAAARASFSGPDIRLPAPVVQPLALVFHELAVNAARHGALAAARGTLSISWKPGPLGTGLTIRWQELGIGIAPKSAKRGFGTVIVGAMVEKQLEGRIKKSWVNEALLIDIEIPTDRSASYDAPVGDVK